MQDGGHWQSVAFAVMLWGLGDASSLPLGVRSLLATVRRRRGNTQGKSLPLGYWSAGAEGESLCVSLCVITRMTRASGVEPITAPSHSTRLHLSGGMLVTHILL